MSGRVQFARSLSEHETTDSRPTTTRAGRVLLAAVIAVLLVLNALAVANQLDRRLDHDEAEYLHAAWLISEGRQIYRDFAEDHPPYLFQLLALLMPRGNELPDVFDWTLRARLLAGACGTWAMIAAGLVVWRITRSAWAGTLTLGALLGAHWTWFRGLADIRADAPTLALFMTGFLLVILEERPSWRMAWFNGIGIALAIGSELWNPKWPLVGLCLGAFFLVQGYRLVRVRWTYAIAAVAPTIAVIVAMYAALLAVTTLGDYLFFTFNLKPYLMAEYKSQRWVAALFGGLSPLHNAPARFAGAIPAAVFVLTILLTIREWPRLTRDRARRVVLVLSMIVAAAIEVRFLHPWPVLWPQVFLMLAFVVAIGYGLLAASIQRIVPLARYAIAVCALTFAVPHLAVMIEEKVENSLSASWPAREAMMNALRPGETVWIGAARHPITAPDDSYFWYALSDLMPMMLDLVAKEPAVRQYLPMMSVNNLPVCRLARGREGRLRFIEISAYAEFTPGACACAQIALSRPDVVPTEVPGVYEIGPPGMRPLGPPSPPQWDFFVRSKVARCAMR